MKIEELLEEKEEKKKNQRQALDQIMLEEMYRAGWQ